MVLTWSTNVKTSGSNATVNKVVFNGLSAGFYGEGNFNMKVTVRINLDIAKIIYALTFLIIAMS